MKIAIGGDHAGFDYKKKLIEILGKEHEIQDFGPNSEESVDYPDHVHPLAKSVSNKENKLGILICGSGNGVSMTANKYQNIRVALCWTEEISKLARQHNDANIVSIPARFVDFEEVEKIVKSFISTEFEGGRHQRRVDKINC